MENKKSVQTLGRPELLGLAVGQVIGAGVITVLGAAIAETGRSVPWAYLLAVIFGFVAIVPYVFLAGALRVEGGDYSIVSALGSELLGGAYGLIKLTGMLPMALYGTSFAMYFASIFPDSNQKIVGIIILTVFYVLNLFGVAVMARVQKVMTAVLIISLFGFIVFGLKNLQYNPLNMRTSDYFLNGKEGFLSAFILLIYSTSGHYLTINYSHEAKNAKRDIPWAIGVTSIIIAVIYVLTAVVASNVLPVSQVAGKPLTDVARIIFSPLLLALYILFGPGMCLTTTMNSSMVAYTRPIYRAAVDGFLPTFFAKTNKNQVPIIMLTICYLIGVIPIAVGLSVKNITNNLVLVSYFTKIIVDICIWNLPKKFPQAWRESHLYMKLTLFRMIIGISIIAQLFITYWAAKNMTTGLLIINITYIVGAFLYAIYRYKSGKANVKISVSQD